MSLFNELKRRNVFRVGIAYVVVAWLVAQVVDLVLENFGAPAWFMRSLLVVLAAGLPLALVFAWAFEMTPEGIKKEKDVDRSSSVTHQTGRKLDRMIIGIMAVVIAFLVLDRFVLEDEGPQPGTDTDSQVIEGTEITEPAIDTGPSIAVLPFVNMSGDANNEYFSDGLTETLLHMLAQLPELRVAARTSSFAFKGKDTGIEEISRTLGVAHVLEGSVQKAGNRVRITAQLIRANDGFHVWSHNYDRDLDDIFAIQDEIANDVAQALDASLLGGSATKMHGVATRDTKAYDLYLQALEQQAIFSYSSLATAENLLKNALATDPGFVDAKLALARNHQMKFSTGLIDEETAWRAMEPLLIQAEEEHPGDPLVRALMLNFKIQNFGLGMDADSREATMNELLSLLPKIPSDTWVRKNVANSLRYFDDFEKSLSVTQAGLMLDPLSADLYSNKGQVYIELERYEEAGAAFKRAIELAPDNPNHYSDMSELAQKAGQLALALDWNRKAIEKDPQDHELVAGLAQTLFLLGLTEEGSRWASRCYALAPQTAVCRRLQLNESKARNDTARVLELATAMLKDDVETRRWAFFDALRSYADVMMKQGRAREAFDFLASLFPGIADHEKPPEDLKATLVRSAGILLMTQFAPREELLVAQDLYQKHLQAAGVPWLDSPNYRVSQHLVRGETEQAKTIALNEQLSEGVASSLELRYRYQNSLYRELAQQPEVAARLRQREIDLASLRSEIETMLLKPEWNL